jgi:hypothetical protein
MGDMEVQRLVRKSGFGYRGAFSRDHVLPDNRAWINETTVLEACKIALRKTSGGKP